MKPVHARLVRDHAAIEGLLQQLRDAVEGADAPTLREVWARFESRLLGHLDAEERTLLPLVELHHAADARAILQDHAEIRRRLAELGVRCDLRLLRQRAADDLIDKLRKHAVWEDRYFYRYLDEPSPTPIVRRLREKLSAVLRLSRRAA